MIVIAFITIVVAGLAVAVPSQAFAASPNIITPTKAENVAYNRCVKAAMNYKKKPQTIKVNIKDLKLSKKQVVDLETRIHSNGELWWINTFGLGLSTKAITMPCKYDDATINSMRKRFNAACNTALKRIGPGMVSSMKVHMLHDYLIKQVKYEDHQKNAYEALVNKRADCFGYTLATDVLMRRAGFQTDVAFNSNPDVDHSWNLVRLGKNWYHIDTTWDRYFTYNLYKGKICHSYLLQSDSAFNQDEHRGWVAHHRCTDGKWFDASFMGEYFSKHCKDYKSLVRSFFKGGVKYVVTSPNKVSVAGISKAKRAAKAVAIPEKVTYKKVTYTVSGIASSSFKQSAAKTLLINSNSFSKSRIKGSLIGSKVKIVKVPKKKLTAYKKYFAKSNSGKKVKVIGLSNEALSKAVLKAQATASGSSAKEGSYRLRAASTGW